MKKTIRNICFNSMIWLIFGGIIILSMNMFKMAYSLYIPENFIWTYSELSPLKTEYNVGDYLDMHSSRWTIAGGRIVWEDYLYCESDTRDGVRVKRNKATDTAIIKRGVTASDWRYGESDYSPGYVFEQPGTNCYIESRQEFVYNKQIRSQIFDSRDIGHYFNILP